MPIKDILLRQGRRNQNNKNADLETDTTGTDQNTDIDQAELSDTFLKNSQGIKKMLAGYLKTPEQVEDVLQESYIRALNANKKISIHSPKAFLYKVARNLSLNYNGSSYEKYTTLMEDFESLNVFSSEPDVEDQVEQGQNFLILCKAVQSLPSQCRKVFVLNKIYGYSHKETAKYLGITVGTVEKHVAKGLLACRKYLHDHGVDFG